MSNSSYAPTYPFAYKIGHFRQSRRLLLGNSQAATPLWEFRWGTTLGHVVFIERCYVTALQMGSFTAGQEVRISAYIARQFTAVDNVNTASILRAGDIQKLNGDNPDSVLTAFVESNSATAASGGTFTLDTDPLTIGMYSTLTTASTTVDGSADQMFDLRPLGDSEQAIRLEKDEGLIIKLETALPAAASFAVAMEMMWAEALKPQ